MKKTLTLLLLLSIVFTSWVPQSTCAGAVLPIEATLSVVSSPPSSPNHEIHFSGLNDPALVDYVEDSVYADIVRELDSDAFFIENVDAIFISKEYLDELAYNSQANIYFGYTLAELSEQFLGTRFVFTLGEDGQTIVQEFEAYDDTYEKAIRNVAIGTGVILLCITVSVVSAGVGAPAISVIFAASAKTATGFALSSGVFTGVTAGIVTGIETKDFDKALKASALAGSEGFMWGAITGSIDGGIQSAISLKGATLNGLTMNEAATIQRASHYPLDVIKEFRNIEQYYICRGAGLTPTSINGRTALVRTIDLNTLDEFGLTNLQRMQLGRAALDPSGLPYEVHHIGQKVNSTLAILTKAEHMQGGNYTIWHSLGAPSEVHPPGNKWTAMRKSFWISVAEHLQALEPM